MPPKKQPPLEAALAYTRIGVEIARRLMRERGERLSLHEMQLIGQLCRELRQYHRILGTTLRTLEARHAALNRPEPD